MTWVVGVPLLGRVSLPGNEIDSESQQRTSVLISGSSRLVKFVVSFNSDFSCNATSLPSPVREAWQRDVLSVS